jgi:chromosomal replication initiator protein
VIASYEHRGGEIDLVAVERLLAGEAQQRSRFRPLTPKALIDKVAAYYDLAAADIVGLKRDKEIVLPRQVAMYLMRNDLNMSYPKVATCVGGRDHTTAMHSVAKIDRALESDEILRADVQSLRTQLSV